MTCQDLRTPGRAVRALAEEKGWSREKAYDTVQPQAIKAWENNLNFRDLITSVPEVRETLSDAEIEDCFDPMYHVRNVDTIFKRVGLL